jgi:hypothetical protein
MEDPNLLLICLSALIAVFILLAILALIMRLIITFFPEKILESDSAVFAAVASVIANFYPGTKISKIEEIK